MEFQILFALLIVITPFLGLRVGIPILVEYSVKNQVNVFPYFFLAVFMGIMLAFTIFLFLEFVNKYLLKIKIYERIFNKYVERIRKKHDKFEKRYHDMGYLALLIFISIPIPGSGSWAGTFLAWLIGLEKKKAFPIIALGLFIYASLILLMSLGFFGWYYR